MFVIVFACAIVRAKNFIVSEEKQVAPNVYHLVDVPVEAVVVPPMVTYINFRHSESEKKNTES